MGRCMANNLLFLQRSYGWGGSSPITAIFVLFFMFLFLRLYFLTDKSVRYKSSSSLTCSICLSVVHLHVPGWKSGFKIWDLIESVSGFFLPTLSYSATYVFLHIQSPLIRTN